MDLPSQFLNGDELIRDPDETPCDKTCNTLGSPLDVLEHSCKLQFGPTQLDEIRGIIKSLKKTCAGHDE